MNERFVRRDVSRTQQRGAELFALIADLIGFLGRTAWPVIDLVIRLWVGKQAIMSSLREPLPNWRGSTWEGISAILIRPPLPPFAAESALQ